LNRAKHPVPWDTYVAPARYGAKYTCAGRSCEICGTHCTAESLPCNCIHATVLVGMTCPTHGYEETVAVTMSTPETCTRCGLDSVKVHALTGSSEAGLAWETPATPPQMDIVNRLVETIAIRRIIQTSYNRGFHSRKLEPFRRRRSRRRLWSCALSSTPTAIALGSRARSARCEARGRAPMSSSPFQHGMTWFNGSNIARSLRCQRFADQERPQTNSRSGSDGLPQRRHHGESVVCRTSAHRALDKAPPRNLDGSRLEA
jgi:hypothetical protein